MNEQHINTQACVHTNKDEAVAGGLCDAAARGGLLGLCMQLCGETHQHSGLAGFWTSSTCGQLDASTLFNAPNMSPAEQCCTETL